MAFTMLRHVPSKPLQSFDHERILKCVKGHFQASGDDCVISICVIILIQLTNLCMFESTFHPQEENNLFIVNDYLIVSSKAFY